MRSRVTRLLWAITVVLVVVAACTPTPNEPPSSTGSAAVDSAVASDDQKEPVDSLPTVVLDDAAGEVEVTETGDRAPEMEFVEARSGVIDIEVVAGTVGDRARIEWPLPADWDEDWVPVVVWEDGAGGWRWLPTEVSTVDGLSVAVGQTDHFSRGFLASIDVGGMAQDLVDSLTALFAGRAGAAVPACEGNDRLADVATVASDSLDGVSAEDDAVLWCVGVRDGTPYGVVTNNRRIFAQVSIPTGAQILDMPGGIDLTSGLAAIGADIESVAAGLPSDRTIVLLQSGESLTLEFPRDQRSGVEVSSSAVGFALSVLHLGMETYLSVARSAGLDSNVEADDLFWLLGDGVASNEEWALIALGCLTSFTETYTSDMSAPADFGSEVEKAISFLLKCGADVGSAAIESGLNWFASALVSTVAAVLSTVVTAAELLLSAIGELRDMVLHQMGRADDPTFDIVLTPVRRPSLDLPAGGRWILVDGVDSMNQDTVAWLMATLGEPDEDQVIEDCAFDSVDGRVLIWGDLRVVILLDEIDQDDYAYGFAFPPGDVAGWSFDTDRDGRPGPSHPVEIEGVSMPTDLSVLRSTMVGWDFADVRTAEDGRRYFQIFAGDVSGANFFLEDDDTVRRATAGFGCEG